jgi:hypothetical protein
MATRRTTKKHRDLMYILRQYKKETGETDVDMKRVAVYAAEMGIRLPHAPSQIDMLAAEFAQAAREETKIDAKTGQPYRVNHAIKLGQLTFWIDIDEAPRGKMQLSLTFRREMMVSDGLQLTLDANHWNNIHPSEEPLQIPLDFTDDVQWRRNGQSKN